MTVLTGSSLDLGTAAVAAAVLTAVTLIRTQPGPPVSQRGEPVSRRSYPLIAAWSAASVLGDTALFKVGWNVMLTLTSPHSPLWWLLPALAASLISKQLLRVSLTQAVYATATQLEIRHAGARNQVDLQRLSTIRHTPTHSILEVSAAGAHARRRIHLGCWLIKSRLPPSLTLTHTIDMPRRRARRTSRHDA